MCGTVLRSHTPLPLLDAIRKELHSYITKSPNHVDSALHRERATDLNVMLISHPLSSVGTARRKRETDLKLHVLCRPQSVGSWDLFAVLRMGWVTRCCTRSSCRGGHWVPTCGLRL
jgi:hypothetical protein